MVRSRSAVSQAAERFSQRHGLAKIAVPIFIGRAMAGAALAGSTEPGLCASTGKPPINPAPDLFPLRNGTGDSPLLGIDDSLYAPTLVIDSAGSRAIVVADPIILPDAVYEHLVNKISSAKG